MVIGFPVGSSLTATERIDTSIHICPQIIEGVLEREVTVFASTMDITALGSTLVMQHLE